MSGGLIRACIVLLDCLEPAQVIVRVRHHMHIKLLIHVWPSEYLSIIVNSLLLFLISPAFFVFIIFSVDTILHQTKNRSAKVLGFSC